jgi:hypothetical protein
MAHEQIPAPPAPATLDVTTNQQSAPTAWESTGLIPPNVRFSKHSATKPMKPWKNFDYIAQTYQPPHNQNHSTEL